MCLHLRAIPEAETERTVSNQEQDARGSNNFSARGRGWAPKNIAENAILKCIFTSATAAYFNRLDSKVIINDEKLLPPARKATGKCQHQ
jgi:hypothetical protein